MVELLMAEAASAEAAAISFLCGIGIAAVE